MTREVEARSGAGRPALWVAALFLVGVLCGAVLPVGSGWVIGAVAACAVAGVVTFDRPRMCSAAISMGLLAAGIGAARIEQFYYAADDIGLFTSDGRQLVQLELKLDEAPREASPVGGQRPMSPRQMARGTVRQILTNEGWKTASGEVVVHVEPPDARLRAGQVIRAMGWLARFAPAMNPGQFDFAGHYRNERLLASFSVRRAENVTVVTAPRLNPLTYARTKARSLLAYGFADVDAIDHALLRALLLGDNDPQLRDIQELFVRTGTSHHLSISGMHVAVLGGFVYLLCRLARLSPRVTAWTTLLFVILYGLVALPNPPVVRSVLLCAFVLFGALNRKSADLIQMLALSVFTMLVVDPLDVYDVGFQLSFGTVLGLMLFADRFKQAVWRVDPDVALAPKPARGRARRWMDWARHESQKALAAAVVAWFVSLPMILLHFDRLNPWAILASLALALVVFAALVAGLSKVVLTLVFPWLAGTWATAAGWPIGVMRWGVEVLAKLPGSDVTLAAPPVSLVVAYYVALMLVLVPAIAPRVRKGLASGAAAMILTIPLLLTWVGRYQFNQTRVTVLAVGAGSCACVELDDGRTILIDAGSSTLTDPYRTVIDPFFHARGIHSADAAYVSHANFDHYGAIADLAARHKVQRVSLTPYFRHDAEESTTATHFLRSLDAAHIPVETISAGRSLRLTPDTTLDVLWPPENADISDNESSLVLRLNVAGRTILFPGDIQSGAMQALLSDGAAIKCDVLVAPHHGSFEPTTPAFIAAASPEAIVSSDDNTPTSRQRTFGQETAGRTVYHTHDHGAVTITIDRTGKLEIAPFRPPPPSPDVEIETSPATP